MLFEPNAQQVLEALLPFYVNRHVYQLVLSARPPSTARAWSR
jgi:F-type H+-transporting ATPase subunit gamma